MYDELIKSIHCCFGFEEPAVTDCENCMMKKWEEYNYEGCCDALGLAAADAIEGLQEDNAALNGTVSNLIQQIEELSKPHWIPVTERLPEEYVNVLCHLRSLDRQSEYYSIDHLMEDGQWWKAANSWKHEVTHWMPLPTPPEENENERD